MQESLNQIKILEAQKHEQHHVKSEKYASPKQHEPITNKHLPHELDDISSPVDAMLVKAQRRANLAQKIGGGAVTSGFGNPQAIQRVPETKLNLMNSVVTCDEGMSPQLARFTNLK